MSKGGPSGVTSEQGMAAEQIWAVVQQLLFNNSIEERGNLSSIGKVKGKGSESPLSRTSFFLSPFKIQKRGSGLPISRFRKTTFYSEKKGLKMIYSTRAGMGECVLFAKIDEMVMT